MPRKSKPKGPLFVKAILIDPFQGALVPLKVTPPTASRFMNLLTCQEMGCVDLGAHLIWFDAQGAKREPQYPAFRLPMPNTTDLLCVFGYGLLTGAFHHQYNCQLCTHQLAKLASFEPWQKRLNTDDYIDQLMRVYDPALAWHD